MSSGPSGILLVDKPAGLTSHDVVARARKWAGTRKVGHAGTLDPMATGLLVLGLGSSTRLLTYLVGLDKEYYATIRLGQSSSTDDAEGTLSSLAPESVLDGIDRDDLVTAISRLTGEIEQVPSTVSAIKVGGKRAYARAREGEEVVLKARAVTVSAFDIVDVRRDQEGIDVDVRVECSSGTYIRALARDLGEDLQAGGHLTALRRTRVGPFEIGDASTLESLAFPESLMSSRDAAERLFAVARLDAGAAEALSHGRRISSAGMPQVDGPIAAVSEAGRLIGLMARKGEQMRVLVNFPEGETGAQS